MRSLDSTKSSRKNNNNDSSDPPKVNKKRTATKSRNGCITCKRRRYKCDETKPSCLQCSKRRIQCEGYAKSFKWWTFAEPQTATNNGKVTFVPDNAPVTEVKTVIVTEAGTETKTVVSNQPSDVANDVGNSEKFNADINAETNIVHSDTITIARNHPQTEMTSISNVSSILSQESFLSTVETVVMKPVHYHLQAVQSVQNIRPNSSGNGSEDSGPDSSKPLRSHSQESAVETDYIVPETIYHDDSDENITTVSSSIVTTSTTDNSLVDLVFPGGNIVDCDPMNMNANANNVGAAAGFDIQFPIYTYNLLDEGTKLFQLYNSTCGIVSVKDGPTENPWRTQIWPIAQHHGALYHSIGAMTLFHNARGNQSLRYKALDHMKSAFSLLAKGMSDKTLPTDVALASTLALAWAQSWDTHISTGIAHLRGAALMLKELLPQSKKVKVPPWLKFLFNSWLYLDVCTRLTSEVADEHSVLEEIVADGAIHEQDTASESIDPLLGCAQTLFPLIGKVSHMASKVRNNSSNDPAIIKDARVLCDHLQEWTPKVNVLMSTFEDPACDLASCIATAEAYRLAALLYLHQAVPEISLNGRRLAKKIMFTLETIPETSRTCVVHIFPLLIAGCEARGPREREWVKQRWDVLSRFMWVGNIDRTVEVVKEVWARKDVSEETSSSKYVDNGGPLFDDDVMDELENSAVHGIKSSCNWSQVMKEWGWEVFLG